MKYIEWAPDTEHMLRYYATAWGDIPPKEADVAELLAETPDHELSVLERGLELYQSGRVPKLTVYGIPEYRTKPENPVAYAGESAWRKWLVERGVRDEDVISIEGPPPGVTPHTGTEAQKFALLAKERGWKTAFTVAPRDHTPRAFLNVITFILRFDVELKAYAICGTDQPWHEVALHSQGETRKTRIELVDGEYDRIRREYDNEYDLVRCLPALAYLKWRDIKNTA